MDMKIKGILLIVVSAIGYAIMPSVSVLAYDRGLSVSQVLLYRFAISAIFIWGTIFWLKIPFKTTFKHLLYIVFIGFAGYTICSKVLFEGYKLVSGSVATMLLFTHPVFVVIGESVIQKTMPSRTKVIAMFLALLGVGIIVWEQHPTYNMMGILLCFLSSVSYAIYCLGLSEPKTRKMHTFSVAAYVITLSAVYNLLECIYLGESLIVTDPKGLTLVVLLAVVGTAIPAITFFSGLKIVGSGAATIISAVEPVFVYALEIIVLGGVIITKNIVGGLVVLVAVILIDRD